MAHFSDTLDKFMQLDGRHARQLDKVSSTIFGKLHNVPHGTISRWRRGEVKKPREWQPIVKLAIVLRLKKEEANELLLAGRHLTVQELKDASQNADDITLLSHWDKLETEVPFEVPSDILSFVGRNKELKKLQNVLLHSKNIRICYLYGMGGVGKTSLAIRVAYELRSHFSDGVLWVTLSKVTNIMSILYGFAAAYGVNVDKYVDLSSRASKVRSLLANKKALIVLDDVSSDDEIQPLLPPTGSCAVLITTRQRDLEIADNAYSAAIKPFDAVSGESLALFEELLEQTPTQAQQSTLMELSDLLGHLPLAIAIAARRIKNNEKLPIDTFLQHLRSQQQTLAILKNDKMQPIRLSFELSYQALPAYYRAVFATLGLFPQLDFDLKAVAYVLDIPVAEASDVLYYLQTLSLIETGTHTRYQLHPLLQDYSRTKSCPTERKARVVSFFVAHATTYAQDYAKLNIDLGNILGSLTTANQLGMQTELLKGTTTIYSFLQAYGLYETAQEYLEQAERVARELQDDLNLIIVLRHQGSIAVQQGKYSQAYDIYQDAFTLAHAIYPVEENRLLTKLGVLSYLQGDYQQTKHYYNQAISLAQQMNDTYRLAILQTNLGAVVSAEGDIAKAESYYKKALDISSQLKDRSQLHITVLQNLGSIMNKRGNYEAAIKYLQKGFQFAQELNNPELLYFSLTVSPKQGTSIIRQRLPGD